MTQIIGFAGKKQSGKNTACNFLVMLKLLECRVCERARLNEEGVIEVSDIFGERGETEWTPFQSPTVNTDQVLSQLNEVKIYSIADSLKQICIDILGLKHKQVYGTDEDKNTKSRIRWSSMPGVVTSAICSEEEFQDKELHKYGLVYRPHRLMTAREILQYVGTDIFRSMSNNVWISAVLRRIQAENMNLALICDVRFDNEIQALKKKKGFLIGLNRNFSAATDTHASEQVHLKRCHTTIDNAEMTIPEQNKAIYQFLKEMECNHLIDIEV